jgi:hypothetical protein
MRNDIDQSRRMAIASDPCTAILKNSKNKNCGIELHQNQSRKREPGGCPLGAVLAERIRRTATAGTAFAWLHSFISKAAYTD